MIIGIVIVWATQVKNVTIGFPVTKVATGFSLTGQGSMITQDTRYPVCIKIPPPPLPSVNTSITSRVD